MDNMSLVRTIILILALVNMVLTNSGHSPLPISDEQVATAVADISTIVVSIWAWWKNNYISRRGQMQKEVLQQSGLYKK